MSAGGDLGNPLRKFKLVFLGEQSGESAASGRRLVLPYGADMRSAALKATYCDRLPFCKVPHRNPEDARVVPGTVCDCGQFD